MASKPLNRRRTLVVNKEMQKRIIFSICLYPTIALAVATLIVAIFCRKLLSEAMLSDAELPSLVPLFLSLLGFAIVAAAIVIHQGLRFSNRVAGPAYRFVKSMERIRDGDVSFRISLRRGDHLTEVASSFNEMLDWLNENPPAGVTTGSDVVPVARSSKPPAEAVGAGADEGLSRD